MAPHEGRRSKKQPAGQQLGVTPLGADNLPAQPARAKSTSSNALTWMVVLLLMLAFSYCTVLPHYGKGWVRHITTRVSLSMAPTSSSRRAPIVATAISSDPAVAATSEPLDERPAAQQPRQCRRSCGTAVRGRIRSGWMHRVRLPGGWGAAKGALGSQLAGRSYRAGTSA